MEVLQRFRRLGAARHLLAGSTLASFVGFGLNAFIASLLIRKFGFSLVQAGLYSSLLASLPGAISVYAGGRLTDYFGARDPAAYAFLPGLSLLLAIPLYLFAISQDNVVPLLAVMTCAALFQYSYLGCTYGVFQNLMQARMRATASAMLNAVYTLIGGGLGPLLVGHLSDRFQAGGTDPGQALAWAMGLTSLIYFWAAAHYLLAARHVADDMAAAREGRV